MFFFNDTDEPIEFKHTRWARPIVIPPRSRTEVGSRRSEKIMAGKQFRSAQAAGEVRVAKYYFDEAT